LGIPIGLVLSILYWFDLGQELRAKPLANRALRIAGLLMGVPQALFGLLCLVAGLAIVGWVLYNSFWQRDPHYTGGFLTLGIGPVLALFGSGLLFDSFRLPRLRVDKRPIDREIENEILGLLVYSDEYQAWLTGNQSGGLKFGFCISGSQDHAAPTQRPDPALIQEAEAIALVQDDFIAKVMAHVHEESGKEVMKPWKNEIVQLRIDAVGLLWPDWPKDIEILFTGNNGNRVWGCGYRNGEPGGMFFR
jgi:hypothetical protein